FLLCVADFRRRRRQRLGRRRRRNLTLSTHDATENSALLTTLDTALNAGRRLFWLLLRLLLLHRLYKPGNLDLFHHVRRCRRARRRRGWRRWRRRRGWLQGDRDVARDQPLNLPE